MTNKKKEDKITKAQEERREKERTVAAEIEKILVGADMALQPFMAFSEFGIAPRVRLVDNNSTTNGQGNSKAEAEVSGDEDKSSEPVTA